MLGKPFSTWTDARLDFGAVGDGIVDDTIAIQSALNNAVNKIIPLFIPSGIYRITQTLTMVSPVNIRILGENQTQIFWDGFLGGTMLYLNGISYSRIGSLIFEGNLKAAIAIDQSWDGRDAGKFDSGNEYADIVFSNIGIGIQLGNLGQGAAEGVINRCTFNKCGIGLATRNPNALDWFVWYSTFKECGIGITNGFGGFHCFNSIFVGSSEADIKIANGSYISIRNNYSINSKKFISAPFLGQNGAQLTAQQNLVIDPKDDTAIDIHNYGPTILLDNTVKSRIEAVNSVVECGVYDNGFQATDLLTVCNNFTTTNAINNRNGRWIAIDDKVIPEENIDTLLPILQQSWTFLDNIVEISLGATGFDIQNLINLASNNNSTKRYTLHFSSGTYFVDETLLIPPCTDIHLIGDGFNTVFLRADANNFAPIFHLQGPSRAILHDFKILGRNAILIDNADQVGSRVFTDQVFLQNCTSSILVNGISHCYLQTHNLYHEQSSGISVDIRGGLSATSDKLVEGRANIFSGASSNNFVSYSVSSGGKLLVRDIWYETPNLPGFCQLDDRGTFTHNNGKIATSANLSTPAIAINNFKGKVAILGGLMSDRIVVAGDGSNTSVLALGQQHDLNNANYLVNNSTSSKVVSLNSRGYNNGSFEMPNTGGTGLIDGGTEAIAFIKDMVAHTRNERPELLTPLPSGVTDVKLYRLMIQAIGTGIEIKP